MARATSPPARLPTDAGHTPDRMPPGSAGPPPSATASPDVPPRVLPRLGNGALTGLLAGTTALPVAADDADRERAADRLAAEVLARAAPRPAARAAGAPSVPGGLDGTTRAFFEPRFGVDLSGIRVHTGAAAARSAARLGAAAYTVGTDVVLAAGHRPGLNLLTAHELAHAVRGDATTVARRSPAGSGGAAVFEVISPVWRVAGRDIVVVATGRGDQVLFFYRRTGAGYKGVGVAPAADAWVPFKTLGEHPDPRYAGKAWFNKNAYYNTVAPEDPLRGYANTLNRDVGTWLDGLDLPAGAEAADWQQVEREMDDVAARYRSTWRGGGGGAGGGPGPGGSGPGGGEIHPGGATGDTLAGATAEARTLRAEEEVAEVAVDAARAGRLARLGSLLLELGLPGPLDVLFLFLQAFASIAEAKARLRADWFATGFGEGLSAALTGTSASDTQDLLMSRVATPSIGERVAGFEGVRERGTNDGVVAGFRFGRALSDRQRSGFLAECFSRVRARGHEIAGDFGRDDLIEMAVALRPVVLELLAEAERQEEARREARRRAGMMAVGNKI